MSSPADALAKTKPPLSVHTPLHTRCLIPSWDAISSRRRLVLGSGTGIRHRVLPPRSLGHHCLRSLPMFSATYAHLRFDGGSFTTSAPRSRQAAVGCYPGSAITSGPRSSGLMHQWDAVDSRLASAGRHSLLPISRLSSTAYSVSSARAADTFSSPSDNPSCPPPSQAAFPSTRSGRRRLGTTEASGVRSVLPGTRLKISGPRQTRTVTARLYVA